MSSCGCKKSFFGGKKRKNKTKRKYKKNKQQKRKTLNKNNKKNNVTMKSFSYQKQGFVETNGKRDYFYFEKVGNKKPIFLENKLH